MAVQFDARSCHLNYLNIFCLCFVFLQLIVVTSFLVMEENIVYY